MGGVLETYEKLIGQMLKELPTPSPHTAGSSNEGLASAITAGPGTTSDTRSEEGGDVKMELNYILKKVQDLKRHKYQEQDKLLQRLQALKHIQVERCNSCLHGPQQSGCWPHDLGRDNTVLGLRKLLMATLSRTFKGS